MGLPAGEILNDFSPVILNVPVTKNIPEGYVIVEYEGKEHLIPIKYVDFKDGSINMNNTNKESR